MHCFRWLEVLLLLRAPAGVSSELTRKQIELWAGRTNAGRSACPTDTSALAVERDGPGRSRWLRCNCRRRRSGRRRGGRGCGGRSSADMVPGARVESGTGTADGGGTSVRPPSSVSGVSALSNPSSPRDAGMEVMPASSRIRNSLNLSLKLLRLRFLVSYRPSARTIRTSHSTCHDRGRCAERTTGSANKDDTRESHACDGSDGGRSAKTTKARRAERPTRAHALQ